MLKSLFTLSSGIPLTVGEVLNDFDFCVPNFNALMLILIDILLECVSCCARCCFECFSVRGIEFTFNNTTELIVPNEIICLLAKTLPGICISGNPGRGNKEANQQELPNLFSLSPNFCFCLFCRKDFTLFIELFTVSNHFISFERAKREQIKNAYVKNKESEAI